MLIIMILIIIAIRIIVIKVLTEGMLYSIKLL